MFLEILEIIRLMLQYRDEDFLYIDFNMGRYRVYCVRNVFECLVYFIIFKKSFMKILVYCFLKYFYYKYLYN